MAAVYGYNKCLLVLTLLVVYCNVIPRPPCEDLYVSGHGTTPMTHWMGLVMLAAWPFQALKISFLTGYSVSSSDPCLTVIPVS